MNAIASNNGAETDADADIPSHVKLAVKTLQNLGFPKVSRRTELRLALHNLLSEKKEPFDAMSKKSFANLARLLRDLREEETLVSEPRIDTGIQFIMHCCSGNAADKAASKHQRGGGSTLLSLSGRRPSNSSFGGVCVVREAFSLRLVLPLLSVHACCHHP